MDKQFCARKEIKCCTNLDLIFSQNLFFLYLGGSIGGSWAFGDFPRHADNLTSTVSPEVDEDSDDVVDCCVGALVQEGGAEDAERVDGKPRSDTSVEGGVRDEKREGIFPADAEYAHH